MRVGIIGTGAISNKHAQAYRNIGFTVRACTDIAEPAGRAFAERWGCDYVPTAEELCRHPEVDYVDVCTFPNYRIEPVSMCAASSKHVLVQKPMAVDLETARRMIEIARDARITLGVVSQHRFDDASLFVEKALAAGHLGKLLQVDAYVKWHRGDAYYSRPIKGTWAVEGGGALITQAIHQVDILSWFGGPVREVFGFWQRGAVHKIESEDVISALIQFESGAQGVIQASTAFWPGFTERVELHGAKGTAILTGDQLTAWDVRDYEGEPPPLASPESSGSADPMAIPLTPFERQFRDFAEACASGRPPKVSAEAGYRALALVLGIYRSCREGRKVALDG